jgi:hypothetical protein
MSVIPSFNVVAVLKLRDKLVEKVFEPRYHDTPEREHFDYLVTALADATNYKYTRDVLYESARELTGVELTPALCFEFAWRLAGNVDRLANEQPVRHWQGQGQDEWAPLQIIRIVQSRNRFGEYGHLASVRILSGTACPLVMTRYLSRAFASGLARKAGFSQRNGHYPYTDAKQLVNIRFVGQIEAAKSTQEPKFGPIHCPPSMLEFNREILRLRLRLTPCPNKWTHPCHRCVVGYETCFAATHRYDYVKAHCLSCGLTTYFDPEDTSGHCIECTTKENTKKQGGP